MLGAMQQAQGGGLPAGYVAYGVALGLITGVGIAAAVDALLPNTWRYCVTRMVLGDLITPHGEIAGTGGEVLGYKIIVVDPQGTSFWIAPADRYFETTGLADAYARAYIRCRGGRLARFNFLRRCAAPVRGAELDDACSSAA